MRTKLASLFPIVLAGWLAGCTTMPTAPHVMVLPGDGKGFEEFTIDDARCRDWAFRSIGGRSPGQAAAGAAATGAVAGTAIGAASGAAIGAAAGDPGAGAAIGAGVGLLGGTAAGAEQGSLSQSSLQQQYDVAYMQCMYAAGNQIPVPAGYRRPAGRRTVVVPPPPPGPPPPPPPGYRTQ